MIGFVYCYIITQPEAVQNYSWAAMVPECITEEGIL